MRAAVLGAGAGRVETIAGIEVEDPRPGEVLVEVRHCGICHSDLTMIDLGAGAAGPLILGHEAAGVVGAVGEGVTSVAAGDAVVITPLAPCGRCYWCARGQATQCAEAQSFNVGRRPDGTTPFSLDGDPVGRGIGVGGWGERTVVPANAAVKVDPDIPLELACLIGCAAQTGVGSVLNTAGVEPGATVLVTGLGGIGQAVVQGARIAGAGLVVVSDPVAGRREAALGFGADHALDPTDGDVVAQVMDATGGIGVDYAFEAAGLAPLAETCLHATRRGGTTVIVGADATMATIALAPVLIATQAKRLTGSLLGDCHPQRDIPRLIRFWQQGRLDLEAMVSHRIGLDDVNLGLDRLRAAEGIRTVIDL